MEEGLEVLKSRLSRMRSSGAAAAVGVWRRLSSRWCRGAAVLGYHRVCDEADPLRLSVSPRNFEEHLAVISRTGRPMRLRDAVNALKNGALPDRTIVVTLDDGYADNLHIALPLLERYEVPATIFVVTGTRGGEFWWDELVRRASAGGAGGDARARLRAERRAAALARELEGLPAAERRQRLDELVPLPEKHSPVTHRSLTGEELERLAGHPLVEIGSHTVSHPPLASLPEQEQRFEIAESKAALEAVTSAQVSSFAYPHGSCSPTTLELVRAAGYTVACSSTESVATAGADVMALPRLWPADRTGNDFGRWLNVWIGR